MNELVGNEIALEIRNQLKLNKQNGNRLGGIHFAEKNVPSNRDVSGKFISVNQNSIEEEKGGKRR